MSENSSFAYTTPSGKNSEKHCRDSGTYELLERGEQDVDLALVFLVGEVRQVVREVLALHLRVALDEFEDLGAA